MSICVCAKCKKPWEVPGSPARCLHCGEVSFPIAVQMSSANISATVEERWQTPEYRAKQSVASIGKHLTGEHRAKISAAHIGRHPTAETRAKISAALKRWHNKKRGSKLNNLPQGTTL